MRNLTRRARWFIATVVFGFAVLDLKVVGDRGGTVDPTTLAETPFGQPGVRQVDDDAYEVYMVARQFLFMPGTGRPLTLPEDSKVTPPPRQWNARSPCGNKPYTG